jgi:hypothetical protein
MKAYWGSGIIAPCILWPRHYMELSGQLHAPAALTQGKSPRYPLDRLGGPQAHGLTRNNTATSDLSFFLLSVMFLLHFLRILYSGLFQCRFNSETVKRLLGRGSAHPKAYTFTRQHDAGKWRYLSMPRAGFEVSITVYVRCKSLRRLIIPCHHRCRTDQHVCLLQHPLTGEIHTAAWTDCCI